MSIRFSLESTYTLGMHRDFISRLDTSSFSVSYVLIKWQPPMKCKVNRQM